MKCRTCDNEAAPGMGWCEECAALVNGFMGCLQEECERGDIVISGKAIINPPDSSGKRKTLKEWHEHDHR